MNYDEIKQAFKEHAETDATFQKMQLAVNEEAAKSRDAIHKRLNDVPTKEDTAQIVEDVITKLLLQKGKMIYSGIIGAALLVGAIIALTGGLKTLLGWVGLNIISK